MYTVSIRSTLAVVYVAVVIAATPTQEDAEHGHATDAPSFNSEVFHQWLDYRKNRIEEAFWRLLNAIAPLLRIREMFDKQQLAATGASPISELNPLNTSKSENMPSKPKKPTAVERESDKPEKEEEATEDDYTDTEDPKEANGDEKNPPEEPHENEKNPSEEANPSKRKDSTKDYSPKPEELEENEEDVVGEAATEIDKELKDALLELNGGSQIPRSTPTPIARAVKFHHSRFKVKSSKGKARALSSRRGMVSGRGLAPTKNSRAIPHPATGHKTKSSS